MQLNTSNMLYYPLKGGSGIMLKNTEEIMAVRLAEIERLVNEFREIMEQGFKDARNIIGINDLDA